MTVRKLGRQSRNTDKPDIKKIVAMRRALLITCASARGTWRRTQRRSEMGPLPAINGRRAVHQDSQ